MDLNISPILSFFLSVLINGFMITYLFPKLNGFSFTGKFFPEGILYALGIEIVSAVVSFLIVVAILATLGLAAIPLTFFLAFGFWLLNAIYLKILAHFLPQHLKIDGWSPAILAGLIMLVVSLVLGDSSMIAININQPNIP
ncbi:MAG: hypothetical protein K8F91_07520 [Candidatus Obscuribacterales bacterium]|nr:hypothetical protein [Candidatus Obscuribacterales bacterium]